MYNNLVGNTSGMQGKIYSAYYNYIQVCTYVLQNINSTPLIRIAFQ